jgi:hypothetical protein
MKKRVVSLLMAAVLMLGVGVVPVAASVSSVSCTPCECYVGFVPFGLGPVPAD